MALSDQVGLNFVNIFLLDNDDFKNWVDNFFHRFFVEITGKPRRSHSFIINFRLTRSKVIRRLDKIYLFFNFDSKIL